MFAIALGMSKIETLTVAISSFIFIGAFTWVSIKGDLRKIAQELIEESNKD
tara:strand:+ start:104 stop:256 length:153 start_codon:yes stop_codon:yes gene_type:complete